MVADTESPPEAEVATTLIVWPPADTPAKEWSKVDAPTLTQSIESMQTV